MMPGMDGLEVIERINEHKVLRQVPVVMQTAASSRDEVMEGIKAGVFHYLTKPLDREVLLSVVAAARADFIERRALRQEALKQKRLMSYIRDFQLELRTIKEAHELAVFVASFFPDPDRVVVGISELLINAVEHGNLGIKYADKSALNLEGRWLEEVERRLRLPENSAKVVRVRYRRQKESATLMITDEGAGFDWQDYLEISPERATDSHGRGIAMANMLSFDSLTYMGRGNEVLCTVALEGPVSRNP